MEIKTTVNFIAEDGTLFRTQAECEVYEKNCSIEKRQERFEKMKEGNMLPLPTIFNPFDEYNTYLITIFDKSDADAVVAYHDGDPYFENSYVRDEMESLLKTHEFPFQIVYREEESFADVYDLEYIEHTVMDFLCGLHNKVMRS